MNRICRKCGKEYPATSEWWFENKKTGKLLPTCKPCRSARAARKYLQNKELRTKQHQAWLENNRELSLSGQHDYYRRNKDKFIKNNESKRLRLRAENGAVVAKIKSGPCKDCGNKFPVICMDFDHVKPGKVMNVSRMVSLGYSIKDIMEEIAKCDLVCACCHRIRTETRRITQIKLVAGI